MPFENVPRLLASIASHDNVSYIFEESGPIETLLKHLSNGPFQSKVSTISCDVCPEG